MIVFAILINKIVPKDEVDRYKNEKAVAMAYADYNHTIKEFKKKKISIYEYNERMKRIKDLLDPALVKDMVSKQKTLV